MISLANEGNGPYTKVVWFAVSQVVKLCQTVIYDFIYYVSMDPVSHSGCLQHNLTV